MVAPKEALRVGLLGYGVVGSQVARLLREQASDLAARVGAPLELVGVAVRDTTVPREGVDPALLTSDAEGLVARCDIVVEVMGGIEPARTHILQAFAAGASVVTANKALLAQDGPTLYSAADAAGVDLYFEAAVAGAIPLVRPLRESLAGDRVERVLGIVNGTTNYILDEMTTKGLAFDDVLRTAQELGYAEADPTADVEGHDAAAKAAIIASLAFHTRVRLDDVACEGITKISAEDVAWAAETGHVIKLLAIAELTDEGVGVRVHPALLPVRHPLAGVGGAYNAVFVEAASAGSLMFYGQGAGGAPTASAVIGDVVSVARHRVLGGKGPDESRYAELPLAPAGATITSYQFRLRVDDRPGVLSRVAKVVAEHGVSIEAMRQQGTPAGGVANLVLTTHRAPEAALAATVEAIAQLDVVQEVTSVLRVEGA